VSDEPDQPRGPERGPQRTTAEPITAVIATHVRSLRESLGLSQEDLAVELNKVGVPWKRATVVNLETRAPGSRGKSAGRDAVTVEELLGLALVLGVPPVGLLYDLHTDEPTPITNQLDASPMEAALWTIGRRPLPGPIHGDDTRESWVEGALADAWHNTAGALEDAWEIEAAIISLESLASVRKNRLLQAYLDDEDVAHDQEAAARQDRRLLTQIQQAVKRLVNSQHPRPELPDFVLARAAELDIKLHGED
jgi:transcriptional regulator with XRE-family HTH domain